MQDHELALEQAEGRCADDGERAHQKHRAGERHGMDDAFLDVLKVVRFVVLIDIAGAQEEERFGNGVIRHVQHESERAQRAANSECGNHDARVLNARVRKEPAEPPLDQNERNGDSHGEHAEQDQQLRCEPVAKAAVRERVMADEAVHCAVQHGRGEHSGSGYGRLAVGVRLPRVHRGDAGLGAVPEQDEDEGEPHRRLVKACRPIDQGCPIQSGESVGLHRAPGGVESDHGTE